MTQDLFIRMEGKIDEEHTVHIVMPTAARAPMRSLPCGTTEGCASATSFCPPSLPPFEVFNEVVAEVIISSGQDVRKTIC